MKINEQSEFQIFDTTMKKMLSVSHMVRETEKVGC
jgi:hypothetical protein